MQQSPFLVSLETGGPSGPVNPHESEHMLCARPGAGATAVQKTLKDIRNCQPRGPCRGPQMVVSQGLTRKS